MAFLFEGFSTPPPGGSILEEIQLILASVGGESKVTFGVAPRVVIGDIVRRLGERILWVFWGSFVVPVLGTNFGTQNGNLKSFFLASRERCGE